MSSQPDHKDFVGSRLTVLTKTGIRYEGTLYDLNQKNATVSLSDVRVHGTEGRASEQNKPEIPPSDNIFKFLVFGGNDIQDLVVLNSPQDVVSHDPAIIAVNVPPEKVNNELKHHQHFQSYSGGYAQQGMSFNSFVADHKRATRGYYNRSPHRRAEGGVLNESINVDELKKEYAKDYDFDTANKNVDKAKIAEEMKKTLDGQLKKGYQPEHGFYDDISNGLSWSRGQTATFRPVR